MNENSENIVEGFLCPICLRDLESFHNLQGHFETAHSREDKAVLGQMKDLFSKAKDRILGNEIAESSVFEGRSKSDEPAQYEYFDPMLWEPQQIGQTKSHFDNFKKRRNARIDGLVMATNKILIRLEKLMQILLENDGQNRKTQEQAVVHWAPDEYVPSCPTCGDKFNVARRRHHCRLCGAIMCTKCSVFISYEFADKIVKSLKAEKQNSLSKSNKPVLNDSQDQNDSELCLRSCVECRNVLYSKQEKIDTSHRKSLLDMLYKKMLNALNNSQSAIPLYTAMAVSLNNGETEYQLSVAAQSRFELMQMFEAVDVLSKKIEQLNTGDEENPPPAAELKLQRNVRRMALSYLQQYMLTLPAIPSEPKLKLLQAKRKSEIEKKVRLQRQEQERKIAEEKRQIRLKQLKEEQQHVGKERRESKESLQPMLRPKNLGVVNNGWSADTVSIFSNSSRQSDGESDSDSSNEDVEFDPIQEQINYVREAARQARDSSMTEEAVSLENNLHELLKEHRRQQTAKAFMNTPTTERALTTFTPSVSKQTDSGEDPLQQQIRYISDCIRDAELQQKWDEADMLKQNLIELKKIIKEAGGL